MLLRVSSLQVLFRHTQKWYTQLFLFDFNMKLFGYKLVILSCLVIELSNITQKLYLFSFSSLSTRLFILVGLGIMFLVYPLLGHLADVYLTRYRTLKCGIIAIVVSLSWFFVVALTHTLLWKVFDTPFPRNHRLTGVFLAPGVITAIIGLGLFEANAIQFGLDQLLEDPTTKLISFIHWYYWNQNVAGLILYYTASLATYYKASLGINNTQIQFLNGHLDHLLVIVGFVTMLIINTALLIWYLVSKKHFYIQRAVSTRR